MADQDRVALGVELLSKLEDPELTVAEAIDRLESITTNPRTTRQILEEAEKQGIIERDAGLVQTKSEAYVAFESEVVTKEGEFSCRRCGASLTTGYFIEMDAGEHGPFGSSCIRKVTGRE